MVKDRRHLLRVLGARTTPRVTAMSFPMVLLLIGCGNSQPENPDSVDVAAIRSMTEQLGEAYVARDWDRFASFFTDDAVWMPPDQPPLIGKEAWWSWIGGGWDQSTIQQLTVNHEEIVIAGDWAFEWHTETQVGEGWQVNFKGIWILQRQDDGSWKIARYSFNQSP